MAHCYKPRSISTRGYVPERSPLAVMSDGYLTWCQEGGGRSKLAKSAAARMERERLLKIAIREDEELILLMQSIIEISYNEH